MAKGDIETYYEGGEWKNRRQGSSRAFEAGEGTKAETEASGRAAAKR